MQGTWKPQELPPVTLCPGVTAKIASGEKIMFSLVTLEPEAVVPEHAHPHEQMGILLSGTMELVIAGKRRLLAENEIYLVPGGVPHAALAGPRGAVALDAFSPPRKEYQQKAAKTA